VTEPAAAARHALSPCDVDDDPIEDRLRWDTRATIEAVFEEELEAFFGRCATGAEPPVPWATATVGASAGSRARSTRPG